MAQLSIALTLPGEAALGTFEAGAVSALLVAVQKINQDDQAVVDVDIMTGASSGSLTAVVAAAALLTGTDPVEPLRRAWVSEPSLDTLRGGAAVEAPLSLDHARTVGHTVLAHMFPSAEGSDERGARAQSSGVTLEFALTCLRGLTYKLHRRDQPAVTATSYIDWGGGQFGPEDLTGLTQKWSAALDAAIASAALPMAFPPVLLDRSRDDYKQDGVTNLPEAQEGDPEAEISLWYADGGLVDREPLGRCISLARGRKDGAKGLVLLIRPCPEDSPSSTDMEWTGGASPPRWRSALGRALRVLVTHSIYEDLRKVESTNDRIAWTEELNTTLAGIVQDNPTNRRRLSAVVRHIRADRVARGDSVGQPLPKTVGDLLKEALQATTRLESKVPVNVEVVAPQSRSDVSGAAVGFAAERLRATDFLVGYEAMLRWMSEGLERYGVPTDLAEPANLAARARATEIPGWIGEYPLRRPPSLRLSAQLLRLGARTARAGLTNPRARGRI